MTLVLRQPDDWHLHLRDGARLRDTVAATARVFRRAIVMPNLRPPVVNVDGAQGYRARIVAVVPPGVDFEPLMTLYLTPRTTPADIENAAGRVTAVKLYPAGATTNADAGVTDLEPLHDVFETMADHEMPLLVHGESIDPDDDVFDREATFIGSTLLPLCSRHPRLRIVLEHITTEEGVAFVRSGGPNIAGTITAHHLLLNRNAIFARGDPAPRLLPAGSQARTTSPRRSWRPRRPVRRRSSSGPTAPRMRAPTRRARAAARGWFTAPFAMGLYAEAFEDAGALDKLEGFASDFGPDFYGLPRNEAKIALVREDEAVPETLAFGNDVVVPMRAGKSVRWRVSSAG